MRAWRVFLLGFFTVGVLLAASQYPAAYLGLIEVSAPPEGTPFSALQGHFVESIRARRPAFILHVVGGMLALATGPFQLSRTLRDRRPQLHRSLGYVYFAGIAVGGVGGLAAAPHAWGGALAHWGFGLLALLWMGVSARGLRLILLRRPSDHQRWMILSYGLTCAALSLRVQMPLLHALGLREEHVYQTVAWSCWIPQLGWWMLRRGNG